MIELQGDLEARDGEDMSEQFVGDLYYNEFGQPMMIIGHHMLNGREQKLEKPYAVLEKVRLPDDVNKDDKPADPPEVRNLDSTVEQTRLDLASLVEKTQYKTEFKVRALVTKKLIFKARPKPIIANVPDQLEKY